MVERIYDYPLFKMYLISPMASSCVYTDAGPIIELGAWLEEQRKALRGRTLDRAKSDRFDTLVEAGKLNWRFNGFTITHSDSSITSQLAAASASSSSSSSPSAGLAAASSSFSSSSSATEIRGTWILAFEALVNYFCLFMLFFHVFLCDIFKI